MRRDILLPILLGALLAAPACFDAGPGPDLRRQVEANRARWLAHRPAAYTFELSRSCFCPESFRGPVTLRVVDGTVVESTYSSSGEPVVAWAVEAFPSVDGLFDVLLDAIARDADSIEVNWDDDSGVPLDFFIDYRREAADEELGYTVVALPVPDAS